MDRIPASEDVCLFVMTGRGELTEIDLDRLFAIFVNCDGFVNVHPVSKMNHGAVIEFVNDDYVYAAMSVMDGNSLRVEYKIYTYIKYKIDFPGIFHIDYSRYDEENNEQRNKG